VTGRPSDKRPGKKKKKEAEMCGSLAKHGAGRGRRTARLEKRTEAAWRKSEHQGEDQAEAGTVTLHRRSEGRKTGVGVVVVGKGDPAGLTLWYVRETAMLPRRI